MPAVELTPYSELHGWNPAGEGRVFSTERSDVFDELKRHWERDPRAADPDLFQVALSTLLDRDQQGHPYLLAGGPACSRCSALFPLRYRDETRLVLGGSVTPQTTHGWDALGATDRRRAMDAAIEWAWRRCRHQRVARQVGRILTAAVEGQGGTFLEAIGRSRMVTPDGSIIVADHIWAPETTRGAYDPRLLVQVHTPSVAVEPPWRPEQLGETTVVELWRVDLDRHTMTVLHRVPPAPRFEHVSTVGMGQVFASISLPAVKVPVDRVIVP